MNYENIMRNFGDVSDDILEYAKKYCAAYSKVSPNWVEKVVFDLLSLDRAEYQLSCIQKDLNMELGVNCKILEVGSGLGSFLMVARKKGIDCYGIEPDENGVETAV